MFQKSFQFSLMLIFYNSFGSWGCVIIILEMSFNLTNNETLSQNVDDQTEMANVRSLAMSFMAYKIGKYENVICKS